MIPNAMLHDLPSQEKGIVDQIATLQSLKRPSVLARRGEALTHLYFPTRGAIAVQASANDVEGFQLSLVDRRGVVGETCILGQMLSPYRLQVVDSGEAVTLPVNALLPRLLQLPELERRLRGAILERIATLTDAAVAHASQTIPTRLAHLLNDRFSSCTEIAVTHRELSSLLAVRRAGVTVALHLLEGRHAIRSKRGRILLLDRAALLSSANP